MRPEQRLRYLTPSDRPPSALPGGARVAVWPVVNVENWLIDNPMPRQVLVAPTGAALLPDIANWGWHEYGMRVGFWRFLDAFAKRGIRPTLSVNGSVCTAYPRVAQAAHEAGWDFMGHGHVQVPTHKVPDQRAMIRQTIQAIQDCTGAPPLGWLGPGLTETLETADLLAEAGLRYCADWVVDDLPCRLETAHGPLITMPYSVELNDIPVVMIQHHDEQELPRRARLHAARLLAEATTTPRVMCIAIHPYITGVPHRIAALEAMLDDLAAMPGIAFMQARDILAWYEGCGDPS
ncbi:polysaccharide deacetylase family protein [Falsiroseomonas sp.]|uniref:polysaccharide deacetylase family protein n=1 Tax=Falsiroseomonas sp. TaxID=2870721 RepID=UPI002718BFB2|nr:polysaccharide deacetylase family protein [Falsiroseomonas sp.]MDO9500850.1 polysaccharide deacetylase family protein [Falsiroseomonas sp.]